MIKSTILFPILIFTFCLSSHAQNRKITDSLKILLDKSELSDSLRNSVFNELMQLSSDPDDIILYANSLLALSNSKNKSRDTKAYQLIGVAHRMKGELKLALQNLLLSAEMAMEYHHLDLLAAAYVEIGATYSSNGDLTNSLIYENKAIEIFRQLNKKQELAINLLNTGFTYYSMDQYDTALLYYDEAAPIFDSLKLTIGQAYTLGNRALVYWKQGRVSDAETGLLQAIEMLKPLGDQFGMADYHNQLGNLYLEQGKTSEAINHLQTGLKMAVELDLKEQIRDASLLLSQLSAANNEYAEAYQYQQQYVAYKDSIQNKENTHKMADLRTEFEVNLREKEIAVLEQDKKLNQTYIVIVIILLLFSIVVLLYFRQRFLNARLLAWTERKAHNDEIQDLLRSQETKALQAMVQGKEEERRHLAKELHNHLGTLLATVKVNLNGLEIPDTAKHQRMIGLVDQACDDVRNISHELNMGVSKDFGLVPALKELVNHLQKSKEIRAEFTASLDGVVVDSKNEILIYRIVQELVSNVLKHAHASKLSISLTGFAEEGLINILVQDNGKGFDTKKNQKQSGGIGLDSLEEMVNKMDGDMGIDSSTQGGTTVSIDLPISSSDLTIEEA